MNLPESDGSDELAWLSSLPDSQLDLLICLKELVILRSRAAGHEELAEKFHPEILGMLGAMAVEYVKERMKGSSVFPYTPEELRSLTGRRMAPAVNARAPDEARGKSAAPG